MQNTEEKKESRHDEYVVEIEILNLRYKVLARAARLNDVNENGGGNEQ